MVAVSRFGLSACLLGYLLLAAALPALADSKAKIEVEITTHLGDRQTFVEGDEIFFLLTLSHDAYIYLYYQDAGAAIYELIPNEKSTAHFYRKGFYMRLPSSTDDFQFRIQAPFGDENLFVFASDNAKIQLEGRKLAGGLRLMDNTIEEIEAGIFRQSNLYFGSAHLAIESQAAR